MKGDGIEMKPIEVMTATEKQQFFNAVNAWATDYGEETNGKQDTTDYIFSFWNEAKDKYLFKMFGNKLILTKEFYYKRCRDEIINDVRQKLFRAYGTEATDFIEEYRDKVVYGYNINDPEWADIRQWMLEALIDSCALATNKYEEVSFNLPVPDGGKKIPITYGCKPIKVLGKIAKAYNLKHFEAFRIAHSMILNDVEVKGKLTLSIHPNDYATMSDNDYGWDSCMSWWNNGGYAQGTVEMMNSPMVVVAYIEGDKPIEFGEGPWSNKRWRELFVVNEDIIAEICPYPYANSAISSTCLKWLRELVVKNLGWYQYEDIDSTFIQFDDGLGSYNGVDLIFRCNYMYNDFRFTHECLIGGDLSVNNWNYSGHSECLWCGEPCFEFDDESALVGMCCDDSWTCACCGDRVWGDRFQIGEEYVCESCYDNSTDTCQCCGDIHIIDDINTIYLGSEDDGWIDRNVYITICDECLNSELSLITTDKEGYHRMEVAYEFLRYIDYKTLTPYGIRKFTGNDMEIEEFVASYTPKHKIPKVRCWYLN